MAYRVTFTKAAAKQLLAIERRQRVAIASWVRDNLDGCQDPRMVGNCKKLKGRADAWRWRMGSYRIVGRVLDDELVVDVFKVGHRRDVYRGL